MFLGKAFKDKQLKLKVNLVMSRSANQTPPKWVEVGRCGNWLIAGSSIAMEAMWGARSTAKLTLLEPLIWTPPSFAIMLTLAGGQALTKFGVQSVPPRYCRQLQASMNGTPICTLMSLNTWSLLELYISVHQWAVQSQVAPQWSIAWGRDRC